MRRSRSLLLIVAAAAALVLGRASPVQAQTPEPTALKSVHLWVNPEYDDPRLLVMLEGQIVGAQAPARVRFLVPSTAEMYSAGSKDASGKYSGGPPDRKASTMPGWDEISYTVTAETFRVEYYDAIGELPDKSFAYEFLRLYPIQGLTVFLQEPRQATGFTVNPQGKPSTDSEGFKVQSHTFADLEVATPVKFDISYTRAASQPSKPTNQASAGAKSNAGLIIGIVLVAVVLGGGGLYLMSRSNQGSKPASRAARRRGGAGNRAKTGRTGPTGPTSFCSQCGRKLERGERFCPNCGTAA
jgi:hypothetical protein